VLTEGFTVQPGYWLFEDLFKGGTTADELRQEIMRRKQSEIDQDYKQAPALAALAAPYRHARLSAMKLAGDWHNPAVAIGGLTNIERRWSWKAR
jgi:hypothetical protein